jgi:hypothetical protein
VVDQADLQALAALCNDPEAKVGCPLFVAGFITKNMAASSKLKVLKKVEKMCSEGQTRGIDTSHYSRHLEADLKRRVRELEVEINKEEQEKLRKKQEKAKAKAGKRQREVVEEDED